MDAGTARMEIGVRLAGEAGNSLKLILAGARRATEAMDSIDRSAEVTPSSEEVASSAQSLARTAQDLQAQVARFKIG